MPSSAFRTCRMPLSKGDASNPAEEIFVHMAGQGPHVLIFLPGNLTTGSVFHPLMQALVTHRPHFSCIALDPRGAGGSTYHQKISRLSDFADDFHRIIPALLPQKTASVTLVGFSMGFGIALELIRRSPETYHHVISLAGIGTRGVRMEFLSPGIAAGKVFAHGDWPPVGTKEDLTVVETQQGGWWRVPGEAGRAIVQMVWERGVLNDCLKMDLFTGFAMNPGFRNHATYTRLIRETASIRYLPESLHAIHRFNLSSATLTRTNGDGTTISITGEDALSCCHGKRFLLLKAASDPAAGKGDLLVNDDSLYDTIYDLEKAGASVVSHLFPAGKGYDHGFPLTRPEETAEYICEFLGDLE